MDTKDEDIWQAFERVLNEFPEMEADSKGEMDTKERFDRAMEVLMGRGPEPGSLMDKWLSDIRNHVTAQDERIRELQFETECMTVHDDEWAERHAALQRDFDDMSERCHQSDMLTIETRKELRALRAKISSAPKVWLWWRQAEDGTWFVRKSTERESDFNGCTMNEWDRIECVHAVPVEPQSEGQG